MLSFLLFWAVIGPVIGLVVGAVLVSSREDDDEWEEG